MRSVSISGWYLQVRQGQRFSLKKCSPGKKDIRCLSSLKVAAIGQGTAKVLEQRGILADLIPEVYDGDSLGEALAQTLHGGEKILIPRASKGNANLVRILEEHGAKVDDVPTYDTIYDKNPLIDVAAEITKGGIDCVVFTSASTVKGFGRKYRAF